MQFEQGKELPSCTVTLEWGGDGDMQPLIHKVTIEGAKKPENFFYIMYFPQVAGEHRIIGLKVEFRVLIC